MSCLKPYFSLEFVLQSIANNYEIKQFNQREKFEPNHNFYILGSQFGKNRKTSGFFFHVFEIFLIIF